MRNGTIGEATMKTINTVRICYRERIRHFTIGTVENFFSEL